MVYICAIMHYIEANDDKSKKMTISKFLDPKNDVAFRKVFGSEEHKDVLIHFLNDVLQTSGGAHIEDVQFLSTIQDPEIASKKQSIVDVLCKAQNGEQIIVEMQVAPTRGFEKRAQYYAAKAYSRQLNKGQGEDGQYHNLKGVIFIAISNTIIFPNKPEYKSDHVVLDKKSYEHDLKDFSFTFLELPKFKKDDVSSLNNMVEKWCFFFKHAHETTDKDLQLLIGSDLVIERAYDALDRFHWTEHELFAYEEEIKRIWDNRAALDYQFDAGLSQGLEKGREEGLSQGLEKGREEGLSQGREEAKRELASKLLNAGVEMQIITATTGLSEKALQGLIAKSRKQPT